LNGEATARVAFRGGAASAPSARGGRRILAGAGALLLFTIGAFAPQHLANDFLLRLADGGLLLGILALSIAFLMSQAGLVSLGAASVYGGVGYLFAIMTGQWNLSPLAAILASMLAVTVYAAVLGALIIRTTPLAFMMLTLAAGEMISHAVLLEGLRDYTSGADGLVVNFSGALFGRVLAHSLDGGVGRRAGCLGSPLLAARSNSPGDAPERRADAVFRLRHL
jgi:branched-chain amino acid transport system permease protein